MLLHIKNKETVAARRRVPFRAVLNADGTTEIEGITWTVAADVIVSLNGGAEAPGAGTIAEIGHGNYYYELDASETDPLGFVLIRISNAASLMRTFVGECQIVAYDPYDLYALGLAAIEDLREGLLGTGSFSVESFPDLSHLSFSESFPAVHTDDYFNDMIVVVHPTEIIGGIKHQARRIVSSAYVDPPTPLRVLEVSPPFSSIIATPAKGWILNVVDKLGNEQLGALRKTRG